MKERERSAQSFVPFVRLILPMSITIFVADADVSEIFANFVLRKKPVSFSRIDQKA